MIPRELRGAVGVGLLLCMIAVCSAQNTTVAGNSTVAYSSTVADSSTIAVSSTIADSSTVATDSSTVAADSSTEADNLTATQATSLATNNDTITAATSLLNTTQGQTTMMMTEIVNSTMGSTPDPTPDPNTTPTMAQTMSPTEPQTPAQNDTTSSPETTPDTEPSTTPGYEDEPIVNDNALLRSIGAFGDHYVEYEGFDGWYNNLAHPDWGGAELPLTRRLPVAYTDGVYSMAGPDRPNPMSISKATMEGKTGMQSHLNRTALMTFFGQQVVEEILDAQRGGCPREYENIKIPDDHEYLKEKDDIKIMPFVRSRYSFNTGYSPNVPREQLNEITPWFDGGLVYGTTKAWADALRAFKGGRLADNGANGEPQFPEQNTLGLPMANPPNPIGEGTDRLKDAKRFFKLGNPRGNENPFLLTFGVLWFRWHNYWADKFKAETDWNDERIFNEARKWVIATYQRVVFYEWLPGYLNLQQNETEKLIYDGYKGYIHPGITHEFQSAAMRFGHTLVPPGVMRRNEQCVYRTSTMNSAGFTEKQYETNGATGNHGVRTCNSFWNPQISVREHDIEEFLLGMASQVTEREDNIITEDLQRRVFGPLEFSRRDLMALNIQRGRDHGLPDYNTARISLGMKPKSFEDINDNSTLADGEVSFIGKDVLDRLAEVYENKTENIDIWAGGLLETTSNGPGELFRFIILDQFVRSRDADRFWFENKLNGQFTEEQIEYIHNVTLWDIIVACTNISSKALQKDPFHYTEDDPCYAQHPFAGQGRTISEDDMENCTTLQTFDYFTGSEVSYALSYVALGIWCVGVVAVLLILAHIRQQRIQEARKLQHRRTRSRDPSSLKTYSAAEWCGKKEGSRQVQVKLGPGKKIRISNERGNKVFRTVDLTSYTKVGLLVSPDGQRRHIVVKFDREYDIVLKFPDPESRLEFISDLESFLGSAEVGVGRERQEIRENELLKVAVTKEHRTKLLEKFFLMAFSQAFKLDFDKEDLEDLNNKETKDVLECELTKTEFAEVLTMKPDSLFVEQMFELVDQDNSGSISFREFLDVIVVFAKGQPEDKLKLMFNMYDIDRSGHLSREEFRQMLKSMMEMVSASVEETDLDKLIHDMFDNAGLGDKQALSLDDFITVMAEHKDQLHSAKLDLDIAGNAPKMPGQEKSAPPGRGAATVIRRGNLNSRARQTIIRAYKDKDQQGGQANGAPKSAAGGGGAVKKRAQKSIRVETVQQDEPKTTNSKAYTVFVRFFENNRLQIFWVMLYMLVLAGVFIERAYYYSVEREFAGLRRIAGFGVSVTRGAASAMMFTYSSILVTMCRNTITKLRETFLHRYIPFDSALAMHKLIAILALLFSILHTIGHSINFYHISTQTADDLTCYFRDFFHRSHELPKFHYWAWGTITGFTGILLVMVCAVIYTFAFQYARRRVFNLFWFTHNMWIIYFILMFLHGSGRLVQPPFTHYFALGPIVLFTLDKLVSVSRKKAEIAVTRADLLPSDVTMLEFKRPQGFEYKSGQWVRIACKTLSSSEYHPFTLTSAPHEENLSLHIRAVGPWTMNLRATYDPNIVREHPLPKLFLDGPYGEGHQDWYQYEVAVLVGGGIGVTPFASILKDIVNKSSIGARITCKKVYFIWVTRTQKHYEWLTDIIRDVEDNDKNDLVSVHIFVTQFFQKFDLRTTMLYICERHFQKISNRSLFTGLKSITHFGRPQFTSFLQSLEDEHPGVGKIGVFSCGPPGMTGGVEQACVDLNKFDGAAFIHHFENF